MGYFDSLSPAQQDSALRALIGGGAAMMQNKRKGLASSMGAGFNAALGQFDKGMAIAHQERAFQAQQDYREAYLEHQRDLAEKRMEFDLERDKENAKRARGLAEYIDPVEQSLIDKRTQEIAESKQRLKDAQRQLDLMQEELDAGKAADTIKEQSDAGPGFTDSLLNSVFKSAPFTGANEAIWGSGPSYSVPPEEPVQFGEYRYSSPPAGPESMVGPPEPAPTPRLSAMQRYQLQQQLMRDPKMFMEHIQSNLK